MARLAWLIFFLTCSAGLVFGRINIKLRNQVPALGVTCIFDNGQTQDITEAHIRAAAEEGLEYLVRERRNRGYPKPFNPWRELGMAKLCRLGENWKYIEEYPIRINGGYPGPHRALFIWYDTLVGNDGKDLYELVYCGVVNHIANNPDEKKRFIGCPRNGIPLTLESTEHYGGHIEDKDSEAEDPSQDYWYNA